MAYRIQCLKCETDTWAGNILALITAYTDREGRFVCQQCGKTETYIATITGLWEREPTVPWTGCLTGVLRIAYGTDGPVIPYAWVWAPAPTADPAEVRLSYYIFSPAGFPVEGPGPGRALVLQGNVRQILAHMAVQGGLPLHEVDDVPGWSGWMERLGARGLVPAGRAAIGSPPGMNERSPHPCAKYTER
jgi:hypothetical protein